MNAAIQESEKPWEGYAAAASFSCSGAAWVNPGCLRWKSPARSPLSTRVQTRSSRWARDAFHAVVDAGAAFAVPGSLTRAEATIQSTNRPSAGAGRARIR